MSYPQFNITTLQLPAPASNMTKAEYKATYGIDLEQVDIKAFKLVLLGKDKYPIDQIKAVEDGYEIYFNGRILSITDIVQTSDEVYDVANSKPMYWHGLELVYATGNIMTSNIHAHIINNSPTPIDTFDKLISWFTTQDAESFIYLDCNGIVQYNGQGLQPISIYRKPDSNELHLAYIVPDQSGYGIAANISLTTLFNTIKDGVNKLN